ncbi:hypothetical protein [Pandoraea apista]|uniref:hypothetical protein n=1 Tax=Pandoraea apista TaxID=93218 RepID=UPI00065DBFEB|nr:hypothetical protein [Pandoraea apista]ALS64221.1 hypothetical protein AT395_03700 [Pandoraea apista]
MTTGKCRGTRIVMIGGIGTTTRTTTTTAMGVAMCTRTITVIHTVMLDRGPRVRHTCTKQYPAAQVTQ